MRRGGGKAKGAQFERDVCRDLSLWVSEGKQEDIFWRSAMSGGRSTIAAKRGKRLAAQAGDISCIHEMGMKFAAKFLIECKFYADLQYGGLMTGKGHLVEFWQETVTEAVRCEKFPLLIAKQNRISPMACLGSDGARLLGIEYRALLIAPKQGLHIIPWHEFLAKADAKFVA